MDKSEKITVEKLEEYTVEELVRLQFRVTRLESFIKGLGYEYHAEPVGWKKNPTKKSKS